YACITGYHLFTSCAHLHAVRASWERQPSGLSFSTVSSLFLAARAPNPPWAAVGICHEFLRIGISNVGRGFLLLALLWEIRGDHRRRPCERDQRLPACAVRVLSHASFAADSNRCPGCSER